jgi:hypothetical protein
MHNLSLNESPQSIFLGAGRLYGTQFAVKSLTFWISRPEFWQVHPLNASWIDCPVKSLCWPKYSSRMAYLAGSADLDSWCWWSKSEGNEKFHMGAVITVLLHPGEYYRMTVITVLRHPRWFQSGFQSSTLVGLHWHAFCVPPDSSYSFQDTVRIQFHHS